MVSRLARKIRQRRPFGSLEQEAYLLLRRTANDLAQGFTELMRPAGITPVQYNVLRILRGAGPAGLSCSELAERMITPDPDVTRLLDRLEAQELITRARDSADRRVVTTRITDEGLRVLADLDEPVAELHVRQLGHLGREKLRSLIALLEEAGTLP